MDLSGTRLGMLIAISSMLGLAACAQYEPLPPATVGVTTESPLYQIGPGDQLDIFVWGNPDLSTTVPVRPDGRISSPLIEDLVATGKTPAELAREIEKSLSNYLQEPLVTVMVKSFVGPYQQTVRVVGAAVEPQAIPYRASMTLLDVMIATGGLTEFAAGNRATIVRSKDNQQMQFGVRLDDLMKNGDISANVSMLPGDVLIVPESFF